MKSLSKIAAIVSIPTVLYILFPMIKLVFYLQSEIFASVILIISIVISIIAFKTFPDDSTIDYLETFIFRNILLITISVSINGILIYFLLVDNIPEFIRVTLIFTIILSAVSSGLMLFDVLGAINRIKEIEVLENKVRRKINLEFGNNTTISLNDGRIPEIEEMYREIIREIELILQIANESKPSSQL